MIKRSVFLALLALVPVALAGWGSGLFFFGFGAFVTGVSALITGCPTNTLACAAGALTTLFGFITSGIGAGKATHEDDWRRSVGGIYHFYEAKHPALQRPTGVNEAHANFDDIMGERLYPRGVFNRRQVLDNLKDLHVGKENEAVIVYHHADGTMREVLYHFNNDSATHQLHASFSTLSEEHARAESTSHFMLLSRREEQKREQVGINTGFGAAYNNMDPSDWANVNHANSDIGYWTSHAVSGLKDNNADSFCLGFQDPTRNNENVLALRVQPANRDTYQGVNFDRCGSDNFRRASSVPASSAALVKVASDFTTEKAREMRIALKRRLGMITERGSGDSQMETSKRTTAGTLLSPVEERADGFCYELDCDTSDDCALFGCPNIDCNTASYKCSERPPECTLHTC